MNSPEMRIAILVTLFATAVALADDFKTTSGKEYKNATVTQVEADGIVIKTKAVFPKFILPSCPKMFRSGFTMIPPTPAAAQAAAVRQTQELCGMADFVLSFC